MPTFNSEALLNQLTKDVKTGLTQAESMKEAPREDWYTAGPGGSWSWVQHFHHLNFYASFYNHAIEKTIDSATGTPRVSFRSGWLGNYFTNIIGPAGQNGQLKMKMKSPANAVPPATEALDHEAVLQAYLAHQNRLLYLLKRARSVDLGRNRAATSLSSIIRLKLGDTFRFLIAHQQRHMQHCGVPVSV